MTKLEAAKEGSVVATLKIRPTRRSAPTTSGSARPAAERAADLQRRPLKEVEEVEPNNDFAKPQPIPMGVTVNGVADNEDIDYFSVRARKGERITAEIEGIRLGLTQFDPYVAIFNAKRFELATGDDSALTWQDGFVSLVAPEDGTYIIAARESAYRATRAASIACTSATSPAPRPRCRPAARSARRSRALDRRRARRAGDDPDLARDRRRDFGLVAQDEPGPPLIPNVFRLSPFGNTIEAEPNDDPAKATPFEPPVALNGVIGTPGDVDQYVFRARKDRTYEVRVFARRLRSPLDSVLSIAALRGEPSRPATTTKGRTATSASRPRKRASTSSA